MAGGVRPFPPPLLKEVTTDDVMAVACKAGVTRFVEMKRITATAMPVEMLLAMADDDEAGYILRAAGMVGYGDGDGDGYGYGYGYGYGDGDGDGDGDGYGDGDGDGDGYGYGYGDE